MYTPHALFSRLFLKICLFVLSVYTVGRLMTLGYKISFHHYSLEIEGKVWSVYIHTVNRIMRCWDIAIWSLPRWPPSWIWSNRKWRRSIRRSRKPHPRTKHAGVGWRVAQLWPFEIFAKCVNVPWGRSVGRQYSYFLHWSHILLFATLGT